jgi:hypothetical protein
MSRVLTRRLAIATALGFAGCAFGLFLDARTMLASYLAAWVGLSAIPIGALAVLLTTYLVRGGWTRDLHTPLVHATLTLPAIAVLFLPILTGLGTLYPWAGDLSPRGALPAFKAAYLTPWFFVLRAVLYFAIWIALAVWARLAYGDERAMKRAASAGLILWALTVSFAGVDWMESVEPHFHSSIYGLFAVSSDLLAGLAFGIVALIVFKRSQTMSNAAYSGVLLSVILLWAYMQAMQYIIIWAGNIPEEIVWYLVRLKDGWGVALWALIVGQFIVPFFILLSANARSRSRTLLGLALATLALRVLEAAVFVLPPLGIAPTLLWLDFPAAILAVGAAWLLALTWAIRFVESRSGRTAAAH